MFLIEYFRFLTFILTKTGDEQVFWQLLINETRPKEHVPELSQVQNIKDLTTMSDKRYRQWRSILPNLPSYNQIYKFRHKINNEIFYFKNSFGFYFNCKEKIQFEVNRRYPHLSFDQGEEIRVRLAGDGTNINKIKRLKNFNFTFNILNDDECVSAFETYTLGYFEISKETNENLSLCLHEINQDLKLLREISVNESQMPIRYYGGGDMLYIANVTGVNTNFNNSECPCCWCKRPRSTFGDYTKCWSIVGEGARTMAEALELCTAGETRDGYVKKPVIEVVEFCDYVIDMLHLVLNVGRKLLELLVEEILLIDSMKSNNSKVLAKLPNLDRLNRFLKEDCRITHPMKEPSAKSKNYELHTFSSRQYLHILELSDLVNLLDLPPDRLLLIHNIWKKFFEVN